MGQLKTRLKILARSRSLSFMRHHFALPTREEPAAYVWKGITVSYRPGTSDTELIYKILLKAGKKGEYAPPAEFRVDPASISTVLDIGANIGVSALYLSTVFPKATIYAFEPEPRNVELLTLNAQQRNNIRVLPFALGARDGELILYDSDNPTNFGGFSSYGEGVNRTSSKTVLVRGTASALDELGISSVDIIKIDTEGAEWDILMTMREEMLCKTKLIIGELHGHRDFALLDRLQPNFHIGLRKGILSRLFNFYAVNRRLYA